MDDCNADSIFLLYQMMLIRAFEEAVSECKLKKMIYGSVHCCNGEEAVAVGVCAALEKVDYIVSDHRPHGHAIAKGVDPARVMAEIFGRRTGTSSGKGGSMHINDASVGMIASTGIVGSGLPLACGAAFASKFKRNGKISCVFFGDGAANEGTLHESLNLAAKWRLPVIFVLEDNEFAVTTNTRNTSACNDYVAMANVYGMKGEHVDGQDVEQVYAVAKKAAGMARGHGDPFLIQAHTIRFNEHAEGEYYLKMREKKYRDYVDLEKKKAALCPIVLYKSKLLSDGRITEELIKDLIAKAEREAMRSVQYAVASPVPEIGTAFENVFVEVK